MGEPLVAYLETRQFVHELSCFVSFAPVPGADALDGNECFHAITPLSGSVRQPSRPAPRQQEPAYQKTDGSARFPIVQLFSVYGNRIRFRKHLKFCCQPRLFIKLVFHFIRLRQTTTKIHSITILMTVFFMQNQLKPKKSLFSDYGTTVEKTA